MDLLPACGGDGMRLPCLSVTIDHDWGVVVDSKKVHRSAEGGQVSLFDCRS
jgi:hypothetical protein